MTTTTTTVDGISYHVHVDMLNVTSSLGHYERRPDWLWIDDHGHAHQWDSLDPTGPPTYARPRKRKGGYRCTLCRAKIDTTGAGRWVSPSCHTFIPGMRHATATRGDEEWTWTGGDFDPVNPAPIDDWRWLKTRWVD